MLDVFAVFLATVVTIPLLGWYIAYIVHVKISKKKPRAVRFAADVSTLLFIIAVYYIMLEIWQQSFLWLILVVIFAVAIVFTFVHWKYAQDIHIWKLLRGIWRFNFLLFSITYILLFALGIIIRIVAIA